MTQEYDSILRLLTEAEAGAEAASETGNREIDLKLRLKIVTQDYDSILRLLTEAEAGAEAASETENREVDLKLRLETEAQN